MAQTTKEMNKSRAEDTLFISILHQKSATKRYDFHVLNICATNASIGFITFVII
jgi:hypothetical protein